MKIFFDTRTHIYEGSVLGSAPDLRIGDRVYVDTMLDGSSVLPATSDWQQPTRSAEGAREWSRAIARTKGAGVARYAFSDPVKCGSLLVRRSSRTARRIREPACSRDAGRCQLHFTKDGRDAQQVSILAVPGADFTFGGWSHLWIFILVFSC